MSMNILDRLPGILVRLLVTSIIAYVFYLVISSLLGIPAWWTTIRSYFPDGTTFAIVGAFLLVAAYGVRNGGGKGSVIFTYILGILLVIAALSIVIFGPDGAKRNYIWFQEAANETAENGISFNGESSTAQPTDATPTPVEVYDVFVPGRGCSEPVANTNPKFWINPFPKDARTGWPNLTLVVTPKTGNGWVPYKDTMKSYSFIRWCNSTGRNMWMTVEVYKGRL